MNHLNLCKDPLSKQWHPKNVLSSGSTDHFGETMKSKQTFLQYGWLRCLLNWITWTNDSEQMWWEIKTTQLLGQTQVISQYEILVTQANLHNHSWCSSYFFFYSRCLLHPYCLLYLSCIYVISAPLRGGRFWSNWYERGDVWLWNEIRECRLVRGAGNESISYCMCLLYPSLS